MPRRNGPSGRPNIMYEVPSLYGTYDCKIPIPPQEIQACRNECLFRGISPCDEDIVALCNLIMKDNNWNFPHSLIECTDTYLKLRRKIRVQLHI